MSFINALETTFEKNSNPENALAMSKYMKNKFSFYGIKTTQRRDLFKTIWKQNQQEVAENARVIALELFAKEQRELHYCAIEILIKELKGNYKKDDIKIIEKLIITNSWWDSVDTISKYILGQYFLEFPETTENSITKFSNSNTMWLNRSAILFQLGYKKETDFELLKAICIQHQSSTAFFIQKAIGWALREYAKTDSEAVKYYVLVNNLKPLSQKEALKNLSFA
ncbi:DNA alkylation repair protein [Flavobacterium sp. FZUC8N2.13]|uniref:DNA alkylation repair protein n=1 Tax=Flavobacterium zubiriense TaxID=3138075 RepID=A0ABV4TBV8_9FLAO